MDSKAELQELMKSLTSFTKNASATLNPKNSIGVPLNKVIDDCAYGLLTQKSLTPEEVNLLNVLLQNRGITT